MRGELITISADGSTSRQLLNDPDHYENLVEVVGGGIDLVSGFSSFEGKFCDAYVHEESALNGMPKNRAATEL